MRYAKLSTEAGRGWPHDAADDGAESPPSPSSASSTSSEEVPRRSRSTWDGFDMPKRTGRKLRRQKVKRWLRKWLCCGLRSTNASEVYFDACEQAPWDLAHWDVEDTMPKDLGPDPRGWREEGHEDSSDSDQEQPGPTWSQAPAAEEDVRVPDPGEGLEEIHVEGKEVLLRRRKVSSSIVHQHHTAAGWKTNRKIRHPPCPISRKHWCESDLLYRIRGANYLEDHIKVPVDSTESIFELGAVDLINRKHKEHICAREDSWVHTSDAPFHFVLYLMVPPCYALVFYWVLPEHKREEVLEGDTPFARVLQGFLDGTDEHRNRTFKLIPTAVEGPWLVRKAVRSTPTLIGCRLLQTYHFGKNYVEVDVNIATNRVAQRTCSLLVGAMKGVVCDLAIVLEGKEEDTLPEALLGTVRMQKVDLAEVSRKEGEFSTT